MADESTTGAKVEVAVDPEAQKEKMKKLIIKVVIIAVVIFAAVWAYKRFVK